MLKTTGVQIEATNLTWPSLLTSIPFSDALIVTGALFWDRRRPRLHTLPLAKLGCYEMQARTPAVPEERARYN